LCNAPLPVSSRIGELYKIETVETCAVERISINDEERQSIGYELQTMYRVNKNEIQEVEISCNGKIIGSLLYAPGALLWRINLGWKRRKEKKTKGFSINPLSGLWSKDEKVDSDYDGGDDLEMDPGKNLSQRIVPYVEDYKNILIFKLAEELPGDEAREVMATLQAALKRGIEQYYEIEEIEIAAEPLPREDDRRAVLFYEASEGGAGVLNRLTGMGNELQRVARKALEIMHYDVSKEINTPSDLKDMEDLKDPKERCVAGCYRCLLSYYNQPEHGLINRKNQNVKDILVSLLNGSIVPKTIEVSPSDTDNELSQFFDQNGIKKPDKLNYPIMDGRFQADAYYQTEKIVVFIKNPGKEAEQYVTDRGFQMVILGENKADWLAKTLEYLPRIGK
jgi:hypothetical protein